MNEERVYLKPNKGLKVRHPAGGHLPDEGSDVVLNTYWRRRMADGDVVKASKPKAVKQDKGA